MLFWKKERHVEHPVEEYLQETESCLASFSKAFDVYDDQGLGFAVVLPCLLLFVVRDQLIKHVD